MANALDDRKNAALAILKKHWGHTSFRAGQWEVIEPVLEGRDVLAVMPTGSGKSICYQIPALLKEGFVLVISPLIALMQDQVSRLRARGVPATFINSSLHAREIEQRWIDAEFGRYRLLYLAPERLQSDVFTVRAGRLDVSLVAIDEAHCISEWGHHFRPAYSQIAEALPLVGSPPVLAVTATATPCIRRDIARYLRLRDPVRVVYGFDRPNIVWSLFREENKRAQVERVLAGVPGSGIIYAATRRSVEQWAEWLSKNGHNVTAYHAGMAAKDRAAAQTAWLADHSRVMVATNAFGMGIDKPDVRFVIHVDMPGTLESYYQEAGRAGRDGERAHAVLLFQERDVSIQNMFVDDGHPTAANVRTVYDAAANLAQIPLAVLPDGPVSLDIEAISGLTGYPAGKVRAAIELLYRMEVWEAVPVRPYHARMRFLKPADDIRDFAESVRNAALRDFVGTLLRTVHADAYTGWWSLDLWRMARRTGLTRERLALGMDFLAERGILRWIPPGVDLQVVFTGHRAQRLPIDDTLVRKARRRAEERLKDMLRYARSVSCRRHFLLGYFGQKSPERCGFCDICLGRHQGVVITPEDEPAIRDLLRRIHDGLPRDAWFDQFKGAPHHRDGLVAWLVQEGYLELSNPLVHEMVLTEKAVTMLNQWHPRETS